MNTAKPRKSYKSFCSTCREPIDHDGFDWYHKETGLYCSYREGGEFDHVATPGGRVPKRKRERQK